MTTTQTQDWKQVTKDNYNTHAKDFAKHADVFQGKLEGWINRFVSMLGKKAVVLDIGCGAGRDSKHFSECGLTVIGIDFSKELVDLIKVKVPDGTFYEMDFETMAFPNDEFHGIWAQASLVHVPKDNLLPVLKHIYKLLKVEGTLFASFRVGDEEKITKEKRGEAMLERFYAYYQPEEIRALLHKAGFELGNIEFELDTIDSGEWVGFFAKK